LTSEVYLGLDISTSCTGWAITRFDGALIDLGWFELAGLPNFHEKADIVEAGLRKIPRPAAIFVEENVLGFRAGSSTAHTIVTLAKFNAIVSHLCWKIWQIAPESITSTRARSVVGLKVPKGENAKVHVMNWAMSRTDESVWPTRQMKAGKRKGETVLVNGCVDAADAFLLVNAGLKMRA
jgi:hypothetical protein